MFKRRYSDEFKRRALNAVARGMSNRQAAALFNMPPSTLGWWRIKAHIRSGTPPSFHSRSPKVHQQAVERFNAGEPARVIAKDLDVSRFSVYAWFHKYVQEKRV